MYVAYVYGIRFGGCQGLSDMALATNRGDVDNNHNAMHGKHCAHYRYYLIIFGWRQTTIARVMGFVCNVDKDHKQEYKMMDVKD